MRTKRHKAIINIIQEKPVYTQEGLLEELKIKGFNVTQATVSRDIKTLDLVKTLADDGKYQYSQRVELNQKANSIRFKAVFIEAVTYVDHALNTVVLKCHEGMANAACAALDTMHFEDVVGTLAGDDTIFILLRNEKSAIDLVGKINDMIS